MTSWELTIGLKNLRGQLNTRWPNRDHASDGTIGDTAHQAETSGHNPDDTSGSKAAWNGDPDSTPEVRAFDCDSDFREPGVTAQMVVDHIRKLPGVSGVLRYMIYNRTMYHTRDGFEPTPYTGASAHTEHIHFEGAWSQAADNNTTFNYRLDEVGDTMAGITVDDIQAAAKAGFIEALADANAAAMGKASADTALDRSKRNVRDYLRNVVGGPTDPMIAAAKGEILAAITDAGVTLSEAQVTAIGDAVGNAANQALQRVVSKLERAGSALTQ